MSLLVSLRIAVFLRCPCLLPLFFDSRVISFHADVSGCTSVIFLFQEPVSVQPCHFLSFHQFLWWTPFFHHYVHGLSTLCPALRPPFSLPLTSSNQAHFLDLSPHWGPLMAIPLLYNGSPCFSWEENGPITLSTLWAGSCHTLGSRGDLLLALTPPSTPLPPHPWEGADRSPGPPHSRQVPDRGIWGGWHRAPSRALRLHLCLRG